MSDERCRHCGKKVLLLRKGGWVHWWFEKGCGLGRTTMAEPVEVEVPDDIRAHEIDAAMVRRTMTAYGRTVADGDPTEHSEFTWQRLADAAGLEVPDDIRAVAYSLSSIAESLVADDTEASREAATALDDALDLLDSAIRTLESDDGEGVDP